MMCAVFSELVASDSKSSSPLSAFSKSLISTLRSSPPGFTCAPIVRSTEKSDAISFLSEG
eukprot:746940-Hanusia_phi.AAC.2